MRGVFRHWVIARLARLAVPAALAVSLVSAPASPALASSLADGGENGGAPPGQLVRRGLSGPVVDVGSSSITVATRFGEVEVLIVPGKTIIRKPPEGIVGIDAIQVGDKVAVLLEKPVVQEPEPTETPETGEQGEGGTTDETEDDDGTEGTETPEDSTEGEADEGESPDNLDDETELEDESDEAEEEGSEESEIEDEEGGLEEQSEGDESSEEEASDDSADQGDSPQETGEDEQAGGEEGEVEEQPQLLLSATALKVLVVPGKATRTHAHAIIKGIERGKLQVIGRDGQVISLDDTSGQGGLLESGDDVVLIVRTKANRPGEYEVRGAMHASDLQERLEQYAQRMENRGKRELVERILEKVHKYEQQLQERLEKLRARVPAQVAMEIDKALEKLRHKGQQAIDSDGEDQGNDSHGQGGRERGGSNRGPGGKGR